MKNCAWRLGSRYGMAYIEDNGLATKLLKMEGIDSKPSHAATATYYTPTGKAFAWQVKFNLDHWDRVARTLGLPVEEKTTKPKPKIKPAPKAKTSGKSKADPKPSKTSAARATATKPAAKLASRSAARPTSKTAPRSADRVSSGQGAGRSRAKQAVPRPTGKRKR